MKRPNIQHLADLRVTEVSCLMEQGCWSSAYYLLGYAIELGLKSCISKQFSVDTIPEKSLVLNLYTHDFDKLIGLAGLRTVLKSKISEDDRFSVNSAICREWTPDARYDTWSEEDAVAFYEAVTDETFGVLPWIKMHW